ncbi:hypothetical protein SD71_09340 [Cohnella kolymensis]|uniref:Fimbrial assembly protein n=1 Tax=Cohnella kolymensis TaxID=1590652 RepID=A0ABR5A6B0_9BACL|nr:hypothetical protein [Cohnella kolymensis]KIL36153.1 hypothetical protein SD71_09340 [Cohnella kolymensis]
MRDINLLPHKSFAERNLILLFLCILAAGFLLFYVQFHYANEFIASGNTAGQEKTRVEEHIRQLSDKKVPDQRTQQYRDVRLAVDQLKLRRTDWLSDITYIVGFLPRNAVIISMNADSSGLLKAEIHFQTMPAVLTYLSQLELESGYESLKVTELTKVSPEPEPAVDVSESLGFPVPAPATERGDSMPRTFDSEYYQMLIEIPLPESKRGSE